LNMETPLLRALVRRIRTLGPLTVSEYMQTCALHPQYGYYQTGKDKIGRKGDFVTAPEVSPIFGELIALWFMVQWRDWLQSPRQIRLIELGPGTGTLMKNMLQTARQFPEFYRALHVQLLEAGRPFQARQQSMLQAYVQERKVSWLDALDLDGFDASAGSDSGPVMFLAHEFLDALPVHHFVRCQRIQQQQQQQQQPVAWSERLVDIVDGGETNSPRLRFVQSRGITPAAALWTSHPLLRPMLEHEQLTAIEVPTGAMAVIERICRIMSQRGGVALVVDYAKAAEPPLACTLRAVRQHRFEDPLVAPGEADITVDVDFDLLAKVAQATAPALQVHVLSQREFLLRMGLQVRLQVVARKHQDAASRLFAACQRLIAPEAMGHVYQVMGIASSIPNGNRAPYDVLFPFHARPST